MKRIKVKYSKLGKQKVWGFAHSEGLIEVDERLKGKKKMEIIIHELCHLLDPDDSEEEVVRKSVILTNTLWHEKYRMIEDHTQDIPLQDGSL
jgi:hypothetical protein